MLKLVICIIILTAVCDAREHLTCLSTDDVLNQQNPQALQGYPGKMGPRGQSGSRGRPGQKGEPGIPDNRQINLLRDQLDFLSQEIEAQKNRSQKNRQLIAAVGKGLYLPPHVYVYQLTPDSQSWQASQEFCQNWGGNLAMHGVKTLENRKKIIEMMSINIAFWIGGNDIASEGNWIWINGGRASSSELVWMSGEPNNVDGNEDCVAVIGNTQRPTLGLAWDSPCTSSFRGLCEKPL